LWPPERFEPRTHRFRGWIIDFPSQVPRCLLDYPEPVWSQSSIEGAPSACQVPLASFADLIGIAPLDLLFLHGWPSSPQAECKFCGLLPLNLSCIYLDMPPYQLLSLLCQQHETIPFHPRHHGLFSGWRSQQQILKQSA